MTPNNLSGFWFLFCIFQNIAAFEYYLTGELTIFVKQIDVGLGVFYVRTSADQVNGNRTKRATGSGYSAGAAAYSPRVWNETAKAWVLSPDVEVGGPVRL